MIRAVQEMAALTATARISGSGALQRKTTVRGRRAQAAPARDDRVAKAEASPSAMEDMLFMMGRRWPGQAKPSLH